MPPAIQISQQDWNGWTVVEVIGEVDIATAPVIRERVIGLLDQGHQHFVLDLLQVSLLDSMGLGMIVVITKRIRAQEGSLRLVCVDEHILKVFRIGGLERAYPFGDSVVDATRHRPRRGALADWPQPHFPRAE